MSARSDFWSRRKARVEAEAEAERAAAAAETDAIEMAEREAKSDEDVLAELALPDPDTLGPDDDFSAFMAKAVPDRLRRRALRKLWLTNPVLANVDGLVEYGEDFTDTACVIENLQTAYQVGRGMAGHVEEMARQAELEAAEDGGPAEENAPEVEETAPEPEQETVPEPEPAPAVMVEALADGVQNRISDEEYVPAPRRRMRFRFADQPGENA